jgi:opacity protein-like surface antigen
MPNLHKSCVAGAILTLAGAANVQAQTVPSPFRYIENGQAVDVFIGVHNPERGRFGLGPGGGMAYGVRYSVEVGGPIGIEGVATYLGGNRDIVDPSRPETERVLGEEPADLLFIDARVRLSLPGRRTWHGMTPFILGGIGLGFGVTKHGPLEAELDAADRFRFGTAFGATLGGGARFLLSDRWALRADASLSLYRLDIPEGYRDPERDFGAVGESEWVSNSGLWLGLSYLF